MEAPLAELRAAVTVLYGSHSGEERHAADAWLRGFVGRDGAWQVLAALLSSPACLPDERYLAATSLRLLCLKQKGVAEPDAAPALAQLLAQQLAAATAAGCWHTGNQLAAALATLAARTMSWPVAEVLPQLVCLVQAAHAAAGAGAEQQQQVAQLRLMACLAEAASSREVGMHPHRREELRAALLAAPQPLAAVQQALMALPNSSAGGGAGGGGGAADGSAAVQASALQLLQAVCALGAPPAGAEAQPVLLQQLHLAALWPELGSMAAEAAAALYASCCPPPHTSSAGSNTNSSSSKCGPGGRPSSRAQASNGGGVGEHASSTPAQRQLLALLLEQLPGFAARLQEALGQAQAEGLGHVERQGQALCKALTLLGAAARAADSQHASGTTATATVAAAAHAVHLGAEVALAAVQHPQFDVALAGLQHFDEQVERWGQHQAAEAQLAQQAQHAGACTPQQRQALLGALCGALLQRMALPPSLPPACTTADARDLPDGVQLVRREVADSFRAAADCLGLQQTRRQLLQLAGQALAAWRAAGAAGSAWQELECCLYALNLVWSRSWQRSQQGREEAAAEVRQAVALAAAALQLGAPKLAGTALTLLGGMAEQLLLLLLPVGPEAPPPQQPQQHQSQLQQAQQQQEEMDSHLTRVLQQLLQLIQQPADEKLSRNAATCCYRLTGHRQLAAALAAQQPGWGDALCQCFAAAGGMRQRARQGDDLSTAQFLLVSICHLAAAGAACSAGQAAGPEQPTEGCSSSSGSSSGSSSAPQLLQHLLTQPATAADAALTAAAAAQAAGQGEQHWQQLEQAAVQIDTVAVALEAVAGSDGTSDSNTGSSRSGSGMQQQLPGLLAQLSGILRRAAAAAAAESAAGPAQQPHPLQQPSPPPPPPPPQPPQQHGLLQAVCRVAAAVAATPAAGTGLQLLCPFLAAPPHPAVLCTLAQLASHASGCASSSSQGLEHLAVAVSSSLRAAGALHADDPDWQAAILLLGEACLLHLPAVAADAATLDAVLRTADHSMRSYHRDVCEQVLRFAEALCCVGCPQQRPPQQQQQQLQHSQETGIGGGALSPPPPPQQHPPVQLAAAGSPAPHAAAAMQHLQQRLDAGGLGAALLLGLLLAAAGGMPPYMMVQIADAQHRIWRAVGDARFGGWLREAALQRAPAGAPWASWKREAQAAAVADLLARECAQDARRFKRLLKVFCGGKKKGQHLEQPARAPR